MRRCACLVSLLLFTTTSSFAQEQDLSRGKRLFDAHCSRCHNMGGTGGEGPSLARPTLRYAADDEALVKVIREGIEGTNMPSTWQISENEARQVALYVRSLGRVEPASLPGDPERGKEVFQGSSGCTGCHMVDGEGGTVGPDLSDVGLRRGAAHLREALVAPGAAVPEGFLLVRVEPRSGDEVVGVRMNEDSFTIQLRDQQARIHSLSKLDLANLEKAFGESLMPSYETELTAGDLEDLVAYLASLRGEP
jgi:putative heme-binding domain-containing protein